MTALVHALQKLENEYKGQHAIQGDAVNPVATRQDQGRGQPLVPARSQRDSRCTLASSPSRHDSRRSRNSW